MDGDGIENVTLNLIKDSSIVFSQVENVQSYDFTLDTTLYPNDSYLLRAKACSQETFGGGCINKDINISINNVVNLPPEPEPTPEPNDITPPSLELIAPNSSERRTNIQIEAKASDESGISYVEIKVNGDTICREQNAPYVCNWYVNGSWKHDDIIEATAVDNAGNSTTKKKSLNKLK